MSNYFLKSNAPFFPVGEVVNKLNQFHGDVRKLKKNSYHYIFIIKFNFLQFI
jgi:hypothetical protein